MASRGSSKTGGRKKGTPNRASAAKAAEIAASGLTPLDFMLSVMRDENAELHVRLDAARSSAPYVNPKLSAIEHSGADGGPIKTEDVTTDDQRVRALRALLVKTKTETIDKTGQFKARCDGQNPEI